MTEEPFRPLIRTQSDLERLWRRLMSPLGFSSYALWMIVIEDDRPVPQIMEIADECEDLAGEEDAVALARMLEHVAGPGLRFAFLRSRPGGGRPDARDLAWARTLHDAGRRSGAAVDVVHLAHDHDVLPIALDDLLAKPA
jgi:hypothetical protein